MPFKYDRCGRKPWKLIADSQAFLLRRLLADRMKKVVTSRSLAEDLAREKQVVVEASTIRKYLATKGYKWLPRAQKRKYTREAREERERFAKAALRLSKEALRVKLAMSMDGVVLSMPPGDDVDRFNYCWGSFTHMWRKPNEANTPPLAGANEYDKQVPLSRSIPLWGGCSEDGFAAVLWHPSKKTNNEEWAAMVRAGKLNEALKKINPRRRSGPWSILCDNESFLRHGNCLRAYAAKQIELWDVPPKSPGLNPIEMFWGWLRRQLRLKDLADLRSKRCVLGKTAYKARVKKFLQTQRAQRMARQFAKKFRGICKKVVSNKGTAA